MTIGVDQRSNSLIVSAPDYVFQDVKTMVEQLDIAGSQKDEEIRTVSLKHSNPLLVERTLNSVLGNATIKTQASESSPGGGRTAQRGNRSGQGGPQQNLQQGQQFQGAPQQIQQDLMRAFQQQGRGGGGAGGRGGRGS